MAGETVAWAPGSSDPKVAFAEFKLHLREITPRLRVVPVVVALNVVVFGAMVATGISPLNPSVDAVGRWGADYGPWTLGGQPWRLLTNVFLHFGIVHLAANMLALLNAGPIIERLFGSVAFAALYLAAGIAGSVASIAVHPFVVSAGASGAIFGVYGALGAVMLLHRETIPPLALKRLGGVAASFIIYNFGYAVGRTGIDNMAHLGGLAGGAVAGALLFRPLVEGRPESLRRPALVLGAAGLLALLALLLLPHPLSLKQIVNDYVDDEQVAVTAYDDLVKRVKARDANWGDAANSLEYGILSGWRQTRAKLEAQAREWRERKQSTSIERQLLSRLRELAAVREACWWRMVTTLRRGGWQDFATANDEFQQRGNDIVDEIHDLERRMDPGGPS